MVVSPNIYLIIYKWLFGVPGASVRHRPNSLQQKNTNPPKTDFPPSSSIPAESQHINVREFGQKKRGVGWWPPFCFFWAKVKDYLPYYLGGTFRKKLVVKPPFPSAWCWEPPKLCCDHLGRNHFT